MPAQIVLLGDKELRLPDLDAQKVGQTLSVSPTDFVSFERDGTTVWINRLNVLYVEDGTAPSLVARRS